MGYTHYWRHSADVDQDIYKLIADDARKIFDTTDVDLHLGGIAMAGSTLETDRGSIWCNGISPNSCETFSFKRRCGERHQSGPGEPTGFEFCKTRRRPYDEVVTAILLSVREHAGDVVRISSDGEEAEWADGVALFEKATGRSAPEIPWGTRDA